LVKRTKTLAPNVMWVNLRLPLHLNLRFAAGQYVDIFLPDGTRRSYSIANPPKLDGTIDLELHIRHMPGGRFTDPLFAGEVKARTRFEFEGPLGSFYLRDSQKPAIMLASGTGYAPIRSILLDALTKGDKRPFRLYWGGRVEQDIYAEREIEDLAATYPNLEFVPVLSDIGEDSDWSGRRGFVHRAVLEDIADLSGHQVYACGAPAMIDAARKDFTELSGLPEEEFYADSFVTAAERAM
jgi:CDP-4-dehydro-6-deoxyglucose reductase